MNEVSLFVVFKNKYFKKRGKNMLKQKDKLIEKLDKRLQKVELFGVVTEEDATEIRNIKSALDGLKVLSEERASKE